MPESRRTSVAALVVTGLAAALMVAAIVTYFLVRSNGSAAADQPTFSSNERAAVSAAGTEMANLQSYRRAHFSADFARALAGSTGSARTQIESNKTKLLQAMNSGKFDLSAKVLHAALSEKLATKGGGYVILISLNGYRSIQKNLPTQQNLEVTVVQKSGKWLVSDDRNIGVS